MNTEIVHVRNLDTGAVGTITRRLFENPAINNGILEEVEPGTKPYLKGFYKSRIEPTEESKVSKEEDVN